MNKVKLLLGVALLMMSLAFAGCPSSTDQADNSDQMAEDNKNRMQLDVDSITQAIDQERERIEALAREMEAVEIPSDSLREKIRQKWSKLHYYVQGGTILRIKTYPHEGISKRTEEFYFDQGQLILAVIEDDGSGATGKPKNQIDKMYYFHNGDFIKEWKTNKEEEFSIRESEAEELLQEANEYKAIYKEQG